MLIRFLVVVLAAVLAGCGGESVPEGEQMEEVGDLRTVFAKAIQAGDVGTVEAMLKEQPLLANEPNTLNNMPPLHVAAANANGQIIKLLLDNGANKAAQNDEGLYAYDLAASKGAGQDVLGMLKVQ